MSTPKRFIHLPWPTATITQALEPRDQRAVASELRILTSPTFGMVDGDDRNWVVYHHAVFRTFRKLCDHLDVYRCDLELSSVFLSYAMLTLVFERLYGQPKGSDLIRSLTGDTRSFVEDFCAAEQVVSNDLAVRQAFTAAALEYICGLRNLLAERDGERKQAFLKVLYSRARGVGGDFEERPAFEELEQRFRAELDRGGAFHQTRAEVLRPLVDLLWVDQRSDKASRRGRIIRASLRKKRLVRTTAERLLKRLERLAASDSGARPAASEASALPDELNRSLRQIEDLGVPTSATDADLSLVELSNHIGSYVIEKEIGAGASGTVHLGRTGEGRHVAIKLVKPEFSTNITDIMQFGREVEIAMRLKHPHIVEALDYGVSEGQPYLVMEYMAGGHLAGKLAEGQPLGEWSTWRIIRQVASALGHAWGLPQRYLHRDVKAENIMFDGRGVAKLADFGLAAGSTKEATRFTQTGTVKGTPFYMAPEQTLDSKSIDIRADLWALGVLAYRCLTGRFPFAAKSIMVLFRQIRFKQPDDYDAMVRNISPGSRALLDRLLEKDETRRYQTPEELIAAIDALPYETAPDIPLTPAPPRLCLSFSDGRELFIFTGNQLRFGRNSKPPLDLCIRVLPTDDFAKETSRLSGEHGRLELDEASCRLYDLSTNGMAINDQILERDQPGLLQNGDVINLAGVLELKAWVGIGSVLLTRRENWTRHAYLLISDSFPLYLCGVRHADWPARPGTLILRDGCLYFLDDAPTRVDGRTVPGNNAICLAPGQTIENAAGVMRVREVEWSQFK